MQDAIGLERLDGVDESEPVMQAVPLSGVAMPLDVEAIAADPVEASEWGVELLAEIFLEAGTIAHDEAIGGAAPLAEDVDGIIELRRPDHGQEARPQVFVDQSFASRGDAGFFSL